MIEIEFILLYQWKKTNFVQLLIGLTHIKVIYDNHSTILITQYFSLHLPTIVISWLTIFWILTFGAEDYPYLFPHLYYFTQNLVHNYCNNMLPLVNFMVYSLTSLTQDSVADIFFPPMLFLCAIGMIYNYALSTVVFLICNWGFF